MSFKQSTALQALWSSIANYNEMIGNPAADKLMPVEVMAACDAQMGLIDDEIKELHLALQEWYEDPTPARFREVRKEFCDVLVTLGGFAHRAGIDTAEDLAAVHQHNMSKFMTRELAETTVDTYRTLEVQTYLDRVVNPETGKEVFSVRSAVNQKDIYGTKYRQGKQLKPAGFQDLDLPLPPL